MEQFMKNTASIDINSSNTIVLQGNGGNAATSFQEGNSANHLATTITPSTVALQGNGGNAATPFQEGNSANHLAATIETQPLNLIGDNLDNNADF